MNVCYLLHDWLKWGEPYEVKTLKYTRTDFRIVKFPVVNSLWQKRACRRCGEVQVRKVTKE